MSVLECPFCGPRALDEFEFRKTIAASPEPSEAASHRAFAQVYLRLEQPGLSREHWQHSAGCRAWLEVRRNPETGAILDVHLLNAS